MDADRSRLRADGAPDSVYEICVEARRQSQALGKYGLLERSYSVEAFSSVHEGDLEARLLKVQFLERVVVCGVERVPIELNVRQLDTETAILTYQS